MKLIQICMLIVGLVWLTYRAGAEGDLKPYATTFDLFVASNYTAAAVLLWS